MYDIHKLMLFALKVYGHMRTEVVPFANHLGALNIAAESGRIPVLCY